jgi:hypothetical protein
VEPQVYASAAGLGKLGKCREKFPKGPGRLASVPKEPLGKGLAREGLGSARVPRAISGVPPEKPCSARRRTPHAGTRMLPRPLGLPSFGNLFPYLLNERRLSAKGLSRILMDLGSAGRSGSCRTRTPYGRDLRVSRCAPNHPPSAVSRSWALDANSLFG